MILYFRTLYYIHLYVCLRSSKCKKVKASSYVAQYPVLRTVQSALHFTSLTDLFTQTPSRLLWEAFSHMLQLMREGCSYTYPPLYIVSYSFIQLSKLEQCRVNKLAQCFNTAASDSNPGSRSGKSEALHLTTALYECLWYIISSAAPDTVSQHQRGGWAGLTGGNEVSSKIAYENTEVLRTIFLFIITHDFYFVIHISHTQHARSCALKLYKQIKINLTGREI